MNKNLNLLVGFIVVLVLIAATTYLISSSRPLKPFSQEEPTASLSAA
ncbi:hypothetical protein HYS93_02480 [Candidatus Daviesbacteria bacterium]|nr:hypothetical protein [Candidatus Daviesbacteria bacterium]